MELFAAIKTIHILSATLLFGTEAVVPEPLRDWAYDRVAANRYRWFGRTDQCALLTPEQHARLL